MSIQTKPINHNECQFKQNLLAAVNVNSNKDVNRKVQAMPQSQIAVNPRHQEEEKKDKNIHAQNKQTNVREAQKTSSLFPKRGDQNANTNGESRTQSTRRL